RRRSPPPGWRRALGTAGTGASSAWSTRGDQSPTRQASGRPSDRSSGSTGEGDRSMNLQTLRRRLMHQASTIILLVTAFSAASAQAAQGSPSTGAAHIAVVVMENHEFGDIHGNACCPYLN